MELSKIIKADIKDIDEEIITRAAEIIKKGGIIIFPTDTIYGLMAQAFDPQVVKKVFRLKGRESEKAMPVLIQSKRQLYQLVRKIPSQASTLIKQFWPGPLTIVFKAKKTVPDIICGEKKSIGVRLPDSSWTRALIKKCKSPLIATSVNPSGYPSSIRIEEIPESIKDKVDLIIDVGPSAMKLPSTVIDMTLTPPKVLREGAISKKNLQEYLPEII